MLPYYREATKTLLLASLRTALSQHLRRRHRHGYCADVIDNVSTDCERVNGATVQQQVAPANATTLNL